MSIIIISQDGTCDKDTNYRFTQERMATQKVNFSLWSSQIIMTIKINLCRTTVQSITTYATQCSITKRNQEKLATVEMYCLISCWISHLST